MKLSEFIVRGIGPKKIFSDENKLNKTLGLKEKEMEYKIPNIKFKSKLSKEVLKGYDIYKFSNNGDKIVLYLHGGAYMNQATVFHYKFVDKVAKESNTDIYFPIYPLVPNHNYDEAYSLILELYKKLLSSGKEIILMGDSAGGGLALSFTLYLKELSLKKPSKLILVSPWVDVTMSNPDLKLYEEMDPMLSISGLVELGKMWAGDLDTKHYKISPLYGELNKLPKVLTFIGTRELIYPDVCLLHDKMIRNGVESELIIGENMNHDYPLYPFSNVKEARDKIINEIIN